MKALGLLALLSIVGVAVAFAETASWNPVSSQPLDGYRLYRAQGTCYLHGYFVMVQQYGPVSSGPVSDPGDGGTYCHFLVAFNQAGESAPSNYVEYAYTAPPPQCPDKAYCMTLKGKARRKCLACQ